METKEKGILFFTGTSHPELAKEIAEHVGVELGNVSVGRFPDNEVSLQIQENVRGRNVFVMQTVALHPNDYLMELLIMMDALYRASAGDINVIIPYFGYCRQDRRDKPRVPITAKLVANMIYRANAKRVLTMDLHAPQLQGFFDIPIDNLYARPEFIKKLKEELTNEDLKNLVVVAPDIGSVKMGRQYAQDLDADFAIVDKQRKSAHEVVDWNIIGDVEGKTVILVDDICSTGETLNKASTSCLKRGAKKVFAIVTHGLFTGDTLKRIEESSLEKLFVSNTVPVLQRLTGITKIEVVSVANLFAHAIHCIVANESISDFYQEYSKVC